LNIDRRGLYLLAAEHAHEDATASQKTTVDGLGASSGRSFGSSKDRADRRQSHRLTLRAGGGHFTLNDGTTGDFMFGAGRGQAACHDHLFDYPIPIAKIAAFVGES
jgi:hypothetical protein